MEGLERIASELRIELMELHKKNNLPHIGSELSCLDILVSVYFANMRPFDIFILSKGHAVLIVKF